MRNKGKRYTDDFKKMIIEVYDTGKPIKEICEEYGVNHGTINNWVNKATGDSKKISEKPIIKTTKENKKAVRDTENEVLRLKKENERIAMENEILKKKLSPYSRRTRIYN